MEIRLACANSLINIENGNDAGVVTGLLATIMEHVRCLPPWSLQSISLSCIADTVPCCIIKEQKASGMLVHIFNGIFLSTH